LSYWVRYTGTAREDLVRLYLFLVEHDLYAAQRAMEIIRKSEEVLAEFPFTCRKVEPDNPFLRELVISFGVSGFIALFEIEDERTVTILALRHQREDDYH
jgi:plasmid stabilization system protein ParE